MTSQTRLTRNTDIIPVTLGGTERNDLGKGILVGDGKNPVKLLEPDMEKAIPVVKNGIWVIEELNQSQDVYNSLYVDFNFLSNYAALNQYAVGNVVTKVVIEIIEPFDSGTTALHVGTFSEMHLLFPYEHNDPSIAGQYLFHPNYKSNNSEDFYFFINRNGANTGRGRVWYEQIKNF